MVIRLLKHWRVVIDVLDVQGQTSSVVEVLSGFRFSRCQLHIVQNQVDTHFSLLSLTLSQACETHATKQSTLHEVTLPTKKW
jgi:hypothetical protein